jgi:hypothetical protein
MPSGSPTYGGRADGCVIASIFDSMGFDAGFEDAVHESVVRSVGVCADLVTVA